MKARHLVTVPVMLGVGIGMGILAGVSYVATVYLTFGLGLLGKLPDTEDPLEQL